MDFQAFALKFLKFGVVGASGVIVDFSITYIAREKIKINEYVANAMGFCVAASTNFYLNRNWTFENQNPEVGEQFLKFFIIALVGLMFNTAIIWFLHQKRGMNFYLAKVFAILVVMVWNFVVNFLYTFIN